MTAMKQSTLHIMKRILHFVLFKSNALLFLSITFFLISLHRRRQRISSSLPVPVPVHSHSNPNPQEFGRYGQLLDQNEFILTNEYTNPIKSDGAPFSCRVYTGLYSHFHSENENGVDSDVDPNRTTSRLSKKFQERLSMANSKSSISNMISFEFVPMDMKQQLTFLETYGTICDDYHSDQNENRILKKYKSLISKEHTKPLAQELWKFCALNIFRYDDVTSGVHHDFDMIAYMDIDSPILSDLDFILEEYKQGDQDSMTTANMKNFAVLGDSLSKLYHNDEKDKTIHGSFLLLHKNNQYKNIAQEMIQCILSDDVYHENEVMYNPLYIPKTLHHLIYKSRDEFKDQWVFLKQRCHSNPFETHVLEQERQTLGRSDAGTVEAKSAIHVAPPVETVLNCPGNRVYCCDILKPSSNTVVMMTRNILLPYQLVPQHPMTQEEKKSTTKMIPNRQYEDPFITTIKEETLTNVAQHKPKNFHQLVLEKNCLPTSPVCEFCMTNGLKYGGGTCKGCKKYCGCYCDMMCRAHVEEKPIRKVFTGLLPKYRRDPTRLIPRIIHQTWFEPITREKYPNFSRLSESWKQQSGWEYRFYDDEDAANFLSTYLPAEVKEAYDILIPGAFKADLFRYCVLFVHGGVYADIDVMLTSKLEAVIDSDIGFMIPLDSTPGRNSNHTMCLWNGLLISQPGHPILAKVIETVVNNIRNRFTSLDVANTLCPNVDLTVAQKWSVLFTSGPCILGATVNKMLNRHPQTSFKSGDLNLMSKYVVSSSNSTIGRAIIIQGNKHDMGAFRFTHTEKNLVVATTDMPNFDDRPLSGKKNIPENHYSNVNKKGQVYGTKGLYKNKIVSHENIRINIV